MVKLSERYRRVVQDILLFQGDPLHRRDRFMELGLFMGDEGKATLTDYKILRKVINRHCFRYPL